MMERLKKTSSDEDGYFTFSIMVTKFDSFKLDIQKEYYQTQSLQFSNLSEEELKNIKITLPKTFITIGGMVTELNENGLHSSVGAKISLQLKFVFGNRLQTETDESGSF